MKFNIGDRVKREIEYHNNMKPGDEGIIEFISESGSLYIEGYGRGHNPSWFTLVKENYEIY